MQIDAHTHILSLAAEADFTTAYGREGSLCIYRSMGLLPSHRCPTDDEWEQSGYSRAGFPVIGPAETVRDHPGFDKIVTLAVSPQYLEGELIDTALASPACRQGPRAKAPKPRSKVYAALVALEARLVRSNMLERAVPERGGPWRISPAKPGSARL